MCVRSWEVTSEVTHYEDGPVVSERFSVGGEIGDKCLDGKAAEE